MRKSSPQKISSTIKEISEIDAEVEDCNIFGPFGMNLLGYPPFWGYRPLVSIVYKYLTKIKIEVIVEDYKLINFIYIY